MLQLVDDPLAGSDLLLKMGTPRRISLDLGALPVVLQFGALVVKRDGGVTQPGSDRQRGESSRSLVGVHDGAELAQSACGEIPLLFRPPQSVISGVPGGAPLWGVRAVPERDPLVVDAVELLPVSGHRASAALPLQPLDRISWHRPQVAARPLREPLGHLRAKLGRPLVHDRGQAARVGQQPRG
ncbi:hypothetical protein [Thermostaphylospora chromogena]|uniref:Uncharacterized protein n=1 Tax=Thermostaphylospora chromogena TaxID=35622 RepID=A0A1H0XL40_9ACTN|nr:hypothetical protein [Thermostaphylospora chromogena]SDQ03336.1 hypothetical protein SAMN04489764_0044 [Thermostaphylospora chromogena]